MKRFIVTCVMVAIMSASAWADVSIDNTFFPDEIFCEYVKSFDLDGDLLLSDDEIANVTRIDVASMDISSLQGIEYFTALTYLIANNNKLTSLDVSANVNLEYLYCHSNDISSLDVSNNVNLTHLQVGMNKLSEIDVSKNTKLIFFQCYHNQLTEIDISNNTELINFVCPANELESLDLSKNTKLEILEFAYNKITSIDLSNNTALEELYCRNNDLISLDLSNNVNLLSVWCSENYNLSEVNISKCVKLLSFTCYRSKIKELDVSNNLDLQKLLCQQAQLEELDISNNEALVELYVEGNTLKQLDINNNAKLIALDCRNNQLTVLDVTNCPDLIDDNIQCDAGVAIIRNNSVAITSPITLNAAVKNKAYSLQLKASGRNPITWKTVGSLPKGLTLSESGLISGIPTKNGSYKIRIKAINDYSAETKIFKLSISNPVEITTTKFKNGAYGKNFALAMKANGTKPITWTASGLPTGLNINERTGFISGVLKTHGNFSVDITASNTAGDVTKTFDFMVNGVAPKISGRLERGELNTLYYSCFNLVRGTEPITWSVDGDIPAGLEFDSTSGILSGTPTEFGTYELTITASNYAGSTSKSTTLRINGKAPKIKTQARLPDATVGEEYSVVLEATGSPTIEWTAENLPAGLTLEDNEIWGTPEESGDMHTITITATNSVSPSKTKRFYLKINAAETSEESEASALPEIMADTTGSTFLTLSDDYKIVAELPEISVDVAGLYDFEVTCCESADVGCELVWLANSDAPSEDDEIAEFYNVDGEEITTMPEDHKVTLSVWLNDGKIYNPVVAIKK